MKMKAILRIAVLTLLAAFIMLPLAGCKHTHKTYVNAPPRHHVKPAPPRSFVPAPKHRGKPAPAPRHVPAPRKPAHRR